ncbi:WAS/WASL-interacting protein family member 3-like [Entelurus aequoreus]|uniref:WAS/WASL-interacting protein family member 3-like n=1 Tax=Entelurus aequoreus TaxID=161455 RepID=UPI002B1D95AB|nr:WAS/WASL-interacting protein family member 3-like [Entelurus aequoreus]
MSLKDGTKHFLSRERGERSTKDFVLHVRTLTVFVMAALPEDPDMAAPPPPPPPPSAPPVQVSTPCAAKKGFIWQSRVNYDDWVHMNPPQAGLHHPLRHGRPPNQFQALRIRRPEGMEIFPGNESISVFCNEGSEDGSSVFFSPHATAAAPKCHNGGRNALLADIQKGARLRKVTQVNDRSSPAVEKPKTASAGVSNNVGASQGPCAGGAPPAPSLGGLFAGGFPTLRPIKQRDVVAKTSVYRSSSSASLKPLWTTPTFADRPPTASSSAPPSPTHGAKHLAPLPAAPPPAPSAPPPPPPPPFPDRPTSKPPPLPSCPPPPPPSHPTKPTWLPIQQHQHSAHLQPSTPPPPPPYHPPSLPGDRSSWCFYPPPPLIVCTQTARFPILRDYNPLGPPPPPPPLPASYTPSCLATQPPPPPKIPAVPSTALRFPPASYPCNAPTRRPPAVPRSAAASRLAPPPVPPARSSSTELSARIPPPPLPPPPPPLPPSSVRNGHLHSLDDFESKFQFHPVEDLPPPDEFKPFPRIYPSKETPVNSAHHGIRPHLR